MPTFKLRSFLSALILLQCTAGAAFAQGLGAAQQDNGPQLYVIDTITVSGAKYLDADLIVLTSGLTKGEKIALDGDMAVAKAIRDLWKQDLFADVEIVFTKVEDGHVSLNIGIKERPRLSAYSFKGISNTQESEIKKKFSMVTHRMVTQAMKQDMKHAIKEYFSEKGYVNVRTTIVEKTDTSMVNSIALTIIVDKGKKVHINQINIVGNEAASDARVKSKMKGTKEMARLSLYPANNEHIYGQRENSFKGYWNHWGFLSLSKTLNALNPYFRWNIFAGSKFNVKKYEDDKRSIISYYNSLGYRDAQIVKDTTYIVQNGNLNIDLKVDEGHKYYFGDIKWKGNTKYSDSTLTKLLGIKKGDIFDQDLLDSRLGLGAPTPGGRPDLGSLYMDNGYLFFQVVPREESIEGDTINYEIAIQEGPQATIKNITISGNDRTNDHVLRRELYTLPGNKFSRADVIRSLRQLQNLGYVDPEKVIPTPKPNLADGTVDIDYNVTEKSSDQLELSAGFGGGVGFTGTVGIVFNNFSMRNLFNLKAWDPLPMGDGQKLSIRYQSNGLWYNSANLSFTEPWLGGKKPTALTINAIYGRQSYSDDGYYEGNPNDHYLRNIGGGVSLSKRLKWPDNNFVLSFGLNYQNYYLHSFDYLDIPNFEEGVSNNLYFVLTLARNSQDQQIYPRSGSNISLTFQFTPPYSAFSDMDYSHATSQEKYRWIEYHKYRFTGEWYHKITGDLVLKLAVKYGFVGYYNKELGFSPFERFSVGGDGLSGYNMFVGKDIISQRGYETGYVNLSKVPVTNATIFNKYTLEVRYPFSLNPSATIFGLAFLEAANGWNSFADYNPFKLYRSAGLGVRIYLPMFGLLGLDYGLGFDRLGNGVKFGNATKFTFMLGFEPD
jgi:outer membrane protein insertion porin family